MDDDTQTKPNQRTWIFLAMGLVPTPAFLVYLASIENPEILDESIIGFLVATFILVPGYLPVWTILANQAGRLTLGRALLSGLALLIVNYFLIFTGCVAIT